MIRLDVSLVFIVSTFICGCESNEKSQFGSQKEIVINNTMFNPETLIVGLRTRVLWKHEDRFANKLENPSELYKDTHKTRRKHG